MPTHGNTDPAASVFDEPESTKLRAELMRALLRDFGLGTTTGPASDVRRASDGARLDPIAIQTDLELLIANIASRYIAQGLDLLRDRVSKLEHTVQEQEQEIQHLRRTVSNAAVIARVSYEDGYRDATTCLGPNESAPAPTEFERALHATDGKVRDVRVIVDRVEHVIGVAPDQDADPKEKWGAVVRSIRRGGDQWAS